MKNYTSKPKSHQPNHLMKYGLLTFILLSGCNSSSNLEPTPVQKQITIKRDSYGTPHVYAKDTFGLFMAMAMAMQ